MGLNKLYGTHYSKEKLMEMGLKLGADVPFCIARGTMLAQGIGEVLTPLTPIPSTYVVLVKPQVSVSTATVYKGLNIDKIKKHPDTQYVIDALKEGNVKEIAKNMVNVLEEVTISMYPEIDNIKEGFRACGAMGTMMSGSGSTVFGLFETEQAAQKACRYFKIHHNIREVYVTTTYSPSTTNVKRYQKRKKGSRRGVKGC